MLLNTLQCTGEPTAKVLLGEGVSSCAHLAAPTCLDTSGTEFTVSGVLESTPGVYVLSSARGQLSPSQVWACRHNVVHRVEEGLELRGLPVWQGLRITLHRQYNSGFQKKIKFLSNFRNKNQTTEQQTT